MFIQQIKSNSLNCSKFWRKNTTLEDSKYQIDTREGELIINSARSSMTFYIGVFSDENAEYTIVASYAVKEHVIKAMNGISSSVTISSDKKLY